MQALEWTLTEIPSSLGPRMQSCIDLRFVYFFLSTGGLRCCNVEYRSKCQRLVGYRCLEGERERQRGRGGVDPMTQPQHYKEIAPPGQNALHDKIYYSHMERERQALGPLNVLQGAPVSSILHEELV